jgi:ribose transport system substrate-binding protein
MFIFGNRGSRRKVIALLFAIALVAAACGSDDDAGDQPSASSEQQSASTEAAPAAEEEASTSAPDDANEDSDATSDEEMDDAFAVQVSADFEAFSGEQVDVTFPAGPAAVPDKSIAIIVITLQDGGAQRVTQGLEDAADALGWDFNTFDSQGDPTQANTNILQALNTNPDAIALVGLEAQFVANGLDAAVEAGVPVVCAVCWDFRADAPYLGAFTAVSPAVSVFEGLGYSNGVYAYETTGGNPQFLMFNDQSLGNLDAREAGLRRFIDECQESGGTCGIVSDEDFLLSGLTTDLPNDAAAAARANPNHNIVWTSFDTAALFAISGLETAGLTDVPVISSNADSANLDAIANGGLQTSTSGIPLEWGSWALFDNLNRFFAGTEQVDHEIPVRLFTADNVPQDNIWVGDLDFEAEFTAIWGS